MADLEAEEKKIANLSFNVDDAITNLTRVEKQLNDLSQKSEKSFKNIESNFDKAFAGGDYSKQIADMQKKMKKYEELTESQQKSISTSLHKQINKRYTSQLEYNEKLSLQAKRQADIETNINLKKNAKIEADNNKHQNKMAEINQKQLKSTQTIYDKIQNYAKTYLIYQGFNMLKSTVNEVIDEMVELEYQMVQIDRVLNDSSLDIDDYRDKLIQLAYDYGNSFDNVADITLRLAQAGFDAQESLALTEKTLLALNTAELNATQATSDMVAVMSQWGLMTGTANEQAETYGNIIDKINKVADNFPTTSEDILNALKKTSSAFNLAGASIDETIAMITAAEVASQRGGKAIGTALSNIIQQLKDAGRLTTIESLGIEVYTDATKTQFNSVIDIIAQLAQKMEELKKSGKENSAEMQNLLEVFTVFRRNIGAGLLGEMAGEDSTYAKVLETSINSVGYSLQENEKHMKTAKAAQEQFNATLLQLKTSVWDNGVEDVFRSMLLLGTDVVNAFKFLIDTFGAIPTAIGTATLAFSMFNKNLKIAKVNTETHRLELTGLIGSLKDVRTQINAYNKGLITANQVNAQIGKGSLKTYIQGLNGAAASTKTYTAQTAAATAATIGLQVAATALNIALSMVLSAAITGIMTGLDKLIHAEEKAIEKQQEQISKTKELIDEYESEANEIDNLISQYEELAQKSSRTPEEENKIYEIQLQINKLVSDQKDQVDLVNGSYEEQLKKLKEISKENLNQRIEAAKKLKEQTANAGVKYELPNIFQRAYGNKDYENTIMEYGGTGLYEGSLRKTLENANIQEALDLFTKWEEKLRDVQGQSEELSNTYEWVSSMLELLTENTNAAKDATEEYHNLLAERFVNNLFSEDNIKTADDYKNALDAINKVDMSGIEGFKDKVLAELASEFPEFNQEAQLAAGNLEVLDSVIDNHLTGLQNLSDQYAMLRNAQDEYNKTGELTISTMQGLIDNNLLQYLSIQNGQLQINAQSLLDKAEATKKDAIQQLQDAAATDLNRIATGDLSNISNIAKGAIAGVGNNAETAGNQMQTAAGKAAQLAVELDAVMKAAEGNLGEGVDVETYKKQAQAVIGTYSALAKNISAINIKSASYSPKKASSGGSGSSAANAAKRAAEQAAREAEEAAEAAAKAEEEAYKKRLEQFKEYIEEKERLEKRWVDNYRSLELLTTKDEAYIISQRIKRYEQYLNELAKQTWIKAEDRLELEKTYTEKLQDLQVEYLEFQKDIMDEQIEALQEANEKRIEQIEEEADAQIEALKKVESENDRIRAKEEYLKNRQAHLDDISYWEQRTGREAQEALKEAKANLKELDDEWNKQLEDWSIEDQIAAIEEQRDAQIKAIQETEAAEIEAIKAAYQAKIDLYVQTGQIIYEESAIQSSRLYEVYKSKFIDPITAELNNLTATLAPPAAPAAPAPVQQQYETYVIKSGDNLTKIAKKFGTTIDKILAANPYVTNKNRIYTGKTLQIPKFHEGGIVGGNQEAFALLKPNEVILKPEWADGINKLAKLARNKENPITNNSTVIEVNGDLVRIDANIKNKTDAEFFTRKVEKMLMDKFNIKK